MEKIPDTMDHCLKYHLISMVCANQNPGCLSNRGGGGGHLFHWRHITICLETHKLTLSVS